jgi:hypothetical protein
MRRDPQHGAAAAAENVQVAVRAKHVPRADVHLRISFVSKRERRAEASDRQDRALTNGGS